MVGGRGSNGSSIDDFGASNLSLGTVREFEGLGGETWPVLDLEAIAPSLTLASRSKEAPTAELASSFACSSNGADAGVDGT